MNDSFSNFGMGLAQGMLNVWYGILVRFNMMAKSRMTLLRLLLSLKLYINVIPDSGGIGRSVLFIEWRMAHSFGFLKT